MVTAILVPAGLTRIVSLATVPRTTKVLSPGWFISATSDAALAVINSRRSRASTWRDVARDRDSARLARRREFPRADEQSSVAAHAFKNWRNMIVLLVSSIPLGRSTDTL